MLKFTQKFAAQTAQTPTKRTLVQKGRIFIIAFITAALCLLFYLFKGFLLVITIGSLLAVATSSITAKFLQVFGGRKMLATACTTALLVVFLIAPFAYAITQLAFAFKNFDITILSGVLDYIKGYDFGFLPESLEFLKPKIAETLGEIDINSLAKQLFAYLGGLTKGTAKIIADIALICVFFFFANLYGTELVIYLKSIVPLKKGDFDEILREVSNVMSVVLYSMVLTALTEGVLFAFIAGVMGYDAVFWGVLFAVSSLIPAVGGLLVYVPLSLYEFATHSLGGALGIFIYSVLVISLIADTFVKPLIIKWINERLVKTPTKINELLIFLAMLAGISSFGFWGIILGPAILTFFISTIKMYVILKEKKLL